MYVVAAGLLGLIAVLGTLQYRWLGRISDAERERRTRALGTHAAAFASDFDRELTRAHVVFQLEPVQQGENLAARVAARYERWQATARYPRLLREVYVVRAEEPGAPALLRFSPGTGFLEPVDWPASLSGLREQTMRRPPQPPGSGVFVRSMPATLIEDVPAIVVPMPMVFLHPPERGGPELRFASLMSYAVLALDREYIVGEMLPALAQQHFGGVEEATDYRLAVVSAAGKDVVYRTVDGFAPSPDDRLDARADLFQVRPGEFTAMVSEIRRFSTFVGAAASLDERRALEAAARQRRGVARGRTSVIMTPSPQMSIVLQNEISGDERAAVTGAAASALGRAVPAASPAGKWRLMVQHRAGSLEAAVDATRRRNLAVSSGILALLGVSVGFLVVSTRRAQQLARQQMEFVAAVSHELRTPLAVIRSAGDNLADGVVHDQHQIRRYGDLVRAEGRRLSEMVEQILEFAGINSGQRGLALRPVAIRPLLEDVVGASWTLIEAAGLRVEYEIAPSLPPVLADEPALRRVFQNLVGNAIKYGAGGGVITLRAAASAREVRVTVGDRGMGIAAAEHTRIFEPFYRTPDVIAAQIQGAGLGLSLVQRIVEAHGGRIALRSAPGEGSEFTVHLPAASEEPVGQAAGVPDPASHGSRA